MIMKEELFRVSTTDRFGSLTNTQWRWHWWPKDKSRFSFVLLFDPCFCLAKQKIKIVFNSDVCSYQSFQFCFVFSKNDNFCLEK